VGNPFSFPFKRKKKVYRYERKKPKISNEPPNVNQHANEEDQDELEIGEEEMKQEKQNEDNIQIDAPESDKKFFEKSTPTTLNQFHKIFKDLLKKMLYFAIYK